MSILTKNLLLGYSFFILLQQNYAQENIQKYVFLDPTGTYVLKGKRNGSEIKGNFAEIRVKLLDGHNIALASYFNTGYPKYASEAFIDTLGYSDNSSTYVNEMDAVCKLVFNFTKDEVDIVYVFKADGHDCFFGKGIIATGKINKMYSEVPIITAMTREQ